MSRADLTYADDATEFVRGTSAALVRALGDALAPARPMSAAERRENLTALAHVAARWPDFPWEQQVRYFATTDDYGAFGRLLIAVTSHNVRDIVAALSRLVPDEAAA